MMDPALARALLEGMARLAEIEVSAANTPIEVLYVQPSKVDGDRCIEFEDFAVHVGRFDDPFSRLFAEYLRRWAELAGARAPGP